MEAEKVQQMPHPVNGFILAAGYGSRLQPLTHALPKPLLPCMGVPLITIALQQLRDHGIQHVGVNTHHLPAHFAYLSEYPYVTLLHEPELLGSAGFVSNLNQTLCEHDLIIYNGDILSDIDFTALQQLHRASNAFATLALLPTALANTRPVFMRDGQVVAIGNDQPIHSSAHTFACAQVLSPAFLRLIATHNFTDINTAWQHALAQNYPLAAFLHRGMWFDIGTPVHFFRAHCALHQKLLHQPDFLNITALLDEEIHLHADHAIVGTPDIHKNCLINTQTFITSSNVTMHASAQLDHCVVMNATTVRGNHSHALLLAEHIANFLPA